MYIEEEKNRSRLVHWRKTTWKRLEEKSIEEMKGSSHRSRKKEGYHGSQKRKQCQPYYEIKCSNKIRGKESPLELIVRKSPLILAIAHSEK